MEDEDEDNQKLANFWKEERVFGEYQVLKTQIYMDEEIDDPKLLIEPFIDTHLLCLEVPEWRKVCMGQFTHVGLGLAVGDQKCVLVELYTAYKLAVT